MAEADPTAPAPTMVLFVKGDKENPVNWSTKKKTFILLAGMSTVFNSTLGSALTSGASPYLAQYFKVRDQAQLALPITCYLIGYVLGPIVFGPLSETYGRRPVLLSTFLLFTVFTLACALAPTYPALLVFRLFSGIFASSPTAVIGGLYADIYADPVKRGRAIALFMACTTFGPTLGPVISGFVSVLSWRWTFWVALIIEGASCPMLLILPETYAPVLLRKRAERLRKMTGSVTIYAPVELESQGWQQLMTKVVTRPIRMIIAESIVLFTCLYLALAYSIFYLFFEAYPIIFQGIYGMSTGVSGLAFLPIAIGALISFCIFVFYDSVLRRAKKNLRPWANKEEFRRLPLACFGGPLYVISLFWLGWTAKATIHWIVPMLAGLPFGIGFLLIFMAHINYLADAYEIFAASALAASSCTRSVAGALLPLVATPMYNRLGVSWATSLLGFISLVMTVIPFVFIRYGEHIRAHSKFSLYLQEQKAQAIKEAEENERKSIHKKHLDKQT